MSSDAALRECERALATAPDQLDLRREHARLLARAGREDEVLSALDLAWRLGADELYPELAAGLERKRVQVGPLTLCYVPAGPFVMGSEQFDDDCAPPHLVELQAFYVTADELTYGALDGCEALPEWMRSTPPTHEWRFRFPFRGDWTLASACVRHLDGAHPPPGLAGRYELPTEAQWERVFRAQTLRPEGAQAGANPYGVRRAETVEWVRDRYDAGYYQRSPRRDPQGPDAEPGSLFVVRGVTAVPFPHFALYRDAADSAGRFELEVKRPRRLASETRRVENERGIRARAVFELA